MSFVYVLTNSAMPNFVKVGHTTTSVEQRMAELYTTSVPMPFECAAQYQVFESRAVESTAHAILVKHRTNFDREFFSCSVHDACAAIERSIDANEDTIGPKTKRPEPARTAERFNFDGHDDTVIDWPVRKQAVSKPVPHYDPSLADYEDDYKPIRSTAYRERIQALREAMMQPCKTLPAAIDDTKPLMSRDETIAAALRHHRRSA